MYFITDLLPRVVVFLTINFYMSFHIASLNDKVRSERVIKLNLIYQYATNLESSVFHSFLDYQLHRF